MTELVLDVGAGDNPDPRSTRTADLHPPADDVFDARETWPYTDDSFYGVVSRHTFEHIPHRELRESVFPEAHRVIEPGGWLEIHVPLESDARTDPTHQSRWEWRTPLHYTDNSRRWQTDLGFELVERRLHVWMVGPIGLLTPIIRWPAKHYPCEFWYELPGVTGELIARWRVKK